MHQALLKLLTVATLASIDSSLLTRTIITHILKDDLGPEVKYQCSNVVKSNNK